MGFTETAVLHLKTMLTERLGAALALLSKSRMLASAVLNVAVGLGTPGSDALGEEISRRVCTKTLAGNTLTCVASWDLEDFLTGSLTEAAIFDSPNSPALMICSTVFSPVVKTVANRLVLTWILIVE